METENAVTTGIERNDMDTPTMLKTTMSVPQMRQLLGLKKTESYWLVHRNFFKTVTVNGRMRVDVDSFEKWYASQVKHKKVNGEAPGAELKKNSYSFREMANLLGVHDADVYEIWHKEGLETFEVDFVKRVPKEVFESWYQNQDKYHKAETVLTDEILEMEYMVLADAAKSIGITKEQLMLLVKRSAYKNLLEVTVYNNVRWITRASFQKFLNAQERYRTGKKADRNSGEPETKAYLTRHEAAELAGVTDTTVTKWMQQGKFRCEGAGKVLRVKRTDFLKWLARYRKGEG